MQILDKQANEQALTLDKKISGKASQNLNPHVDKAWN